MTIFCVTNSLCLAYSEWNIVRKGLISHIRNSKTSIMGFTDREILTISSLTDNNKSEQRTLLVRKKKHKEGRGRKKQENVKFLMKYLLT